MNLDERYSKWKKIIETYTPEKLEEIHSAYKVIFSETEIPLIWCPDENNIKNSNLYREQNRQGFTGYKDFFNWAKQQRAAFWENTVKTLGIKFNTPFQTTLPEDYNAENPDWFPGASLNIIDSCFHQNNDQIAIYEGGETTEIIKTITYGDLKSKAEIFGSNLLKQGLKKGDKIILYLPFTSEAVIAYLGIIRVGMIAVSVADSFSSEELRKRAAITDAKVVITCDEYLYGGKTLKVYEKVIESGIPKAIVCCYGNQAELRSEDLQFRELLRPVPLVPAVYSMPQETINILFSSGTTKEPKAIPWTHLTPVKCASDGYYHLDIKGTDIVTWTTGMGWMMAPWLIFASLINKASIAIYTGAATGEGFGKFTEKTGITILGTIPSVVKVWRNLEFHRKYNWQVRLFSSTGEPSNPDDYFYLMAMAGFKAPIIEYCGGTEIGGGYITGTVIQPSSPATFTTPALGLDFYLLKPDGSQAEEGEQGEVFLVPPSVGLTQKLLNRDHHEEYYSGTPIGPDGEILRKHGDAFEKHIVNGNTFYKSSGRTDDAMNLGGIKVSSIELEEVINQHEVVFESAAVAVPSEGGGPEKLVVFLVLKTESKDPEVLKKELQKLITEKLNPLFRIAEVKILNKLPRTASNKVMRRELRKELMR